jgi:hypothetical protein
MFKYTKYILMFFGVLAFALVVWASVKGWGIPAINNRVIMEDAKKDCPDYEKDQWGNCPPSSHRNHIRYRNHWGGGSGGGGK